jgi:hypothetical protein
MNHLADPFEAPPMVPQDEPTKPGSMMTVALMTELSSDLEWMTTTLNSLTQRVKIAQEALSELENQVKQGNMQ